MEQVFQEEFESKTPPVNNAEAVIRHFREDLISGKNWYIALLESIGLWTDEAEDTRTKNTAT